MRQQSALFGSMGRSLVGTSIEPGDADISFPQAVVPAIEPLYTHEPFFVQAAGGQVESLVTATQSFITELQIIRATGLGSSTTRPFMLTNGIWRLKMNLSCQVPAVVTNFFLAWSFLTDTFTALQNATLFRMRGTGAVRVETLAYDWVFAIGVGRVMRFQFTLDNTGGATDMSCDGSVVTAKIS